jgi:transcriptional repressor NrdR
MSDRSGIGSIAKAYFEHTLMRCPKCASDQLAVIDSRSDEGSIRRRRECEKCGFRFNTFERIELALPLVLKKDGRREAFDRAKLRSGLFKACEKTSVSAAQIEATVEKIEARVLELCLKEMPSRQIGDFLMEELQHLDKVAYVRFASVYREFRDVNQFMDTLQSLATKRGKRAAQKSGVER